MTIPRDTENVVLAVGAGVMTLVVLYAVETEVLGLDRSGCRYLFLFAAALGGLAGIVRYVRMGRLGMHLTFLEPPVMAYAQRGWYLLWLVVAALVGAYACYDALLGGVLVPTVGNLASLSSMLVLVRGLLRPPPT